jgi:hypothetical protein
MRPRALTAFASLACFTLCALGAGCSSGDFAVAATTSDAGTDAAPPSACDPAAGVAKFCVSVSVSANRPSYDGASQANQLGIDGAGVLYVYLYDKDPSPETKDPTQPTINPISTLRFPDSANVGAELKLDADLPKTLAGTATPNTYWVVATFQDNKALPRTAETGGILPGDFLLVPTITGKKADYPKLLLETGKTAKLDVVMRPYHRVVANVHVDPKSDLAKLSVTNRTIHGDGPMLFLLYANGVSITDKSVQALSLSQAGCVNVKPSVLTPPTVAVPFGTWAEGGLQILGALLDYPGATFPTPGMITSDLSTPPVVQIAPSTWSSAVDLPLNTYLNPNPATSTMPDPYVCN